MPSAPIAGWYPDPRNSRRLWWWDGSRWATGEGALTDRPHGSSIRAAVRQFAEAALPLLHEGGPLHPRWAPLVEQLHLKRVPVPEALDPLRAAALGFLQTFSDERCASGAVTSEDVSTFADLARQLGVPETAVSLPLTNLRRRRVMTDIRAGRLPRAEAASRDLGPGETCYLEVDSEHVRTASTGSEFLRGRMLVTSLGIRFRGGDTVWEVSWPQVVGVRQVDVRLFHLETTESWGAGHYRVEDAEYVATVIEAAASLGREAESPI